MLPLNHMLSLDPSVGRSITCCPLIHAAALSGLYVLNHRLEAYATLARNEHPAKKLDSAG